MARAPFQVAAFPVRVQGNQQRQYAVFRRRVEGYWQAIAGGGEADETPLEAIQRESFEEAGIPFNSPWIVLQTQASVPITHFQDRAHWDDSVLVIPIYHFGVIVSTDEINLSSEHVEYQWVTEERAQTMLKWDSDCTALWELEQLLRLQRIGLR
ncbi:MAG: NUDIX domain-containing protein [Anaerolineaceae bacterium]|nr:NUDIX domain-containing protein [Anaerolineaceae bacterium]